MKKISALTLSLLAMTACVQQRPAPIEFKGDTFYGQDGAYDKAGNEMPRYSNRHRARMSEWQDERYVNDDKHQYGVSAAVDSVGSSDLPPLDQIDIDDVVATNNRYADRVADFSQDELQRNKEKFGVFDDASEPLDAAKTYGSDAYDPMKRGIENQHASISSEALEGSIDNVEVAREADGAVSGTFVWPLRGKIIGGYNDSSKTISISGREGEPVRATAGGVIAHADNNIASYGNMILIRHEDGYVSSYAHLSAMVVDAGDEVIEGELIGFVGSTGNVQESQLAFGLRQNNQPIDPTNRLTQR